MLRLRRFSSLGKPGLSNQHLYKEKYSLSQLLTSSAFDTMTLLREGSEERGTELKRRSIFLESVENHIIEGTV